MTTQTKHPVQNPLRIARNALGSSEMVALLSELFHALGDPTRLKIVVALSVRELCVAEVAQVVGMSESAVSHQLRLLKTLRLIRPRKSGKQVYYVLDDSHVDDLLRIGRLHALERSR